MTSSGAARFLPGLVAVAMMSGASTASAQSFWYRHGIPGIGAFSAPPTEPCGESPYPGQVCADGSIYAGLSPDGDIAMYVAASSAPSTLLWRSEEHTSELQSLMRISYAVFCLKKKNIISMS